MKNFKFRFQKALFLFWETLTSREVDSKLFRSYISMFFYEDYNTDIIIHFTKVRVIEYESKFVVEITTHRPGILIGRAGSTIDSLKEFLNRGHFPKQVEIRVQEAKMWLNCY